MRFRDLRQVRQPSGSHRAALDLASAQMNNLAVAMNADGKIPAAIAVLRRAVSLNPDDVHARLILATIIVREPGGAEEALGLIEGAPETDHKVHLVRAYAAQLRNDMAESIRHFAAHDRLTNLGPDQKFGEGHNLLLSGDWAAGWEKYETLLSARPYGTARRWQGEHVDQLLLVADQGQGDIINFIRYVPWAAKRAQKVILSVPTPMYRLLHRYQNFATIVMDANDHPANAQTGLTGLPRLHGTRPDNVPADPGLLHCDPLGLPPRISGKKRVGICWAGNKQFANDRWRSMPFEAMLPLAGDSRVDLFSLQAGPRAGDIAQASAQFLVADLSGAILHEWAATAGAIQALDAIVTVDTSIAHMAGALGKRCFLCLPYMPDWRWLLGRDDTPWYPSVRLVRQERLGDWAGVIERVAKEL